MDRDPASAALPAPLLQILARLALATALVAAGLWILRGFIVALLWAGIFAIVLWPLYRRLLRILPAWCERETAPLLLVIAVALVFILPLVFLGLGVARESHVVLNFINDARQNGIPTPDILQRLPLIGAASAEWWHNNLGTPAAAQELFGKFNPRQVAESARQYGGEIAHRLVLFGFTLLTLFFLFRHGAQIVLQLRDLSDRLLGVRGERIAAQMIAAVHGTVTGLVLVGLAEGVILGFVYFAVGLPYPASVGAATGVAAVIPFAAPAVYCLAALYLIAQGNMVGAIVILAAGSAVVFVADHFIRPVLIGGAARLPFLWVLLGILGGVETLGFLGLFLGPAIMAALIAMWRESTNTVSEPEAVRAAAAPRSRGRRSARRRG
jgi:predicted PurR-regulated permease PerM